MSQIKDFAKGYTLPAKTKNIADLPEVSTELELVDDSYEVDDNGKTKVIEQKIVEINGERYRVPNSVFQQLKVMLEDNPTLKRFKVKKTGVGMETRYTVIPLS